MEEHGERSGTESVEDSEFGAHRAASVCEKVMSSVLAAEVAIVTFVLVGTVLVYVTYCVQGQADAPVAQILRWFIAPALGLTFSFAPLLAVHWMTPFAVLNAGYLDRVKNVLLLWLLGAERVGSYTLRPRPYFPWIVYAWTALGLTLLFYIISVIVFYRS